MTTSHAFQIDSISFTLPRGLLDDAQGMSLGDLRATYCATGPIRLGSWEFTTRGSGRYEFDATFAVGDTIHSASSTASGPAEAMTAMLYDAGAHLEILSFHQQSTDAGIVTFALCSDGDRSEWAMGMGDHSFTSTARALIAGANRLR